MTKRILLIATILLLSYASKAQVPDQERDVLMAIFNATDGENWIDNTNWNTDSPVATWFGVSVSEVMGEDHVTAIDFAVDNGLNGYLPADIGGLSELVLLEIAFNNLLTGNIPVEIGQLQKLETLVFWDDNFTGNIPAEIGNCINLTALSLESNGLTGNIPVELANLTSMTSFWLNDNNLSGKLPNIFSNWLEVVNVALNDNQFSGNLDLSVSPNLRLCWIQNNNFFSLNFKNGNNVNTNNFRFKVTGNPNLTCVIVDDIEYSTSTWTNIDENTSFMNDLADCGIFYTDIPDVNFEMALIEDGYDDIVDHRVLRADIEEQTTLNVRNSNINDLTGINDFTSVTYLNVGGNNIASIDLSQNVNITGLFCYDNDLSSLTVNQMVNLDVLNCSQNDLTALDVSSNQYLKGLFCVQNNLTTLDVSANSALEKLWCYENSLTDLDVRNSANGLLMGTYTAGEDTYSKFRASENPSLTCILVDDAVQASSLSGNYQDWEVDATVSFVESPEACDVNGIQDQSDKESFHIYPNPTSDMLNIRGGNGMEGYRLSITNIFGQMLINNIEASKIDMSEFPEGIYYLSIENGMGDTMSYKIVKK